MATRRRFSISDTGVQATVSATTLTLPSTPPPAPAGNNTLRLWFDQASNDLKFQVTTSDGTVKTGTLAVT